MHVTKVKSSLTVRMRYSEDVGREQHAGGKGYGERVIFIGMFPRYSFPQFVKEDLGH